MAFELNKLYKNELPTNFENQFKTKCETLKAIYYTKSGEKETITQSYQRILYSQEINSIEHGFI